MSLKIAFIYSSYYPINSGVSNASKNLAEALVKNGDDITFYTIIPFRSKLKNKEIVNGVKVIRLRIIACLLDWITFGNKSLKYRICTLYIAIRVKFSRETYNYIFGHTIYWGGTYAYIIGKINKIPSIAMAHGEDVNQLEGNPFKERLTRTALKNLDYVFATNTDFITILDKYLSRSYSLLPNVFPERTSATITEKTIEERFNNGSLNLISIGRLDVFGPDRKEIKGISTALKAMGLLPQKITLQIVGNGELRDRYLDFIERNNLSSQVRLLGQIGFERLQEILNGSSVLLLPSNIEGLSMVMVEAMAKGLPVIATNIGGAKDYIKNGGNGFLINTGDSEALAKIVERLASDKRLYKKLSENSRSTYLENFTETSVSSLLHQHIV
jgi:glycosyltransferase involved in cell wall biosynthesis